MKTNASNKRIFYITHCKIHSKCTKNSKVHYSRLTGKSDNKIKVEQIIIKMRKEECICLNSFHLVLYAVKSKGSRNNQYCLQ